MTIATLAVGLAADVQTDIVGQTAIGMGVWAVMLMLLERAESNVRSGLLACLVIATAGEMFLSLGWGLYTYRLANIPLFVPPGHVLMLLLGLSLARRLSDRIALAVIGCAGAYSIAVTALGVDTLALPLFIVLVVASIALPDQRRLYASTFMLSLALELYGTWLGNWTWKSTVPGLPLATTNPPGTAGAFYCALDALAMVASMMIIPRLSTFTAQTHARLAWLSARLVGMPHLARLRRQGGSIHFFSRGSRPIR
ncbi:MAG: hypothetical protein ABJA83_11445 [Burkholderiaceae bacterium]